MKIIELPLVRQKKHEVSYSQSFFCSNTTVTEENVWLKNCDQDPEENEVTHSSKYHIKYNNRNGYSEGMWVFFLSVILYIVICKKM